MALVSNYKQQHPVGGTTMTSRLDYDLKVGGTTMTSQLDYDLNVPHSVQVKLQEVHVITD